jgi:polyhydroxyalkanoate synthesis repressor PhaR
MSKVTREQATAEKRLEISKYSNRRFYDKTRSRHLTLEEIYAAIREGYEIHVTDSKTGKDITGKLLAQIILELDSPKLEVFPVELLHRLLRSNERLMVDFTQKYFSKALMAFMDSQKKTEQYLRETMGLSPAGGLMTDWAKAMMSPFKPGVWGAGENPAESVGGPESGSKAAADKIEELQKMIVQLQDELTRSRKSTRATKSRRSNQKSA